MISIVTATKYHLLVCLQYARPGDRCFIPTTSFSPSNDPVIRSCCIPVLQMRSLTLREGCYLSKVTEEVSEMDTTCACIFVWTKCTITGLRVFQKLTECPIASSRENVYWEWCRNTSWGQKIRLCNGQVVWSGTSNLSSLTLISSSIKWDLCAEMG